MTRLKMAFLLLFAALFISCDTGDDGGGGDDEDSNPSKENLQKFAWSSDSTYLAFMADSDNNGKNELYSVWMDGNGFVKASGDIEI